MSYQIDSIFQILNPDNTIHANRFLAHAIGMAETIIYSALISKFTYYSGKGMVTEDGWFYSTVYDLQESTTYGEKPQKNAIKHLMDCGLVECKVMGLPARRYFRICNDFDKLNDLIRTGSENAKGIISKGREKNADKSQKRDEKKKTAKQDSSSQMAEQENPQEKSVQSAENSSSAQTAELIPSESQNRSLPDAGTGADLPEEHTYNNHNLFNPNFMNHKAAIKSAVAELEKYKTVITNIIAEFERKMNRQIEHVYDVYENPKYMLPPDKGEKQRNHEPVKKKDDEKKNNQICESVISHLNALTGSAYKPLSRTNKELVNGLLSEGFTESDIITVIDKKYAEWSGTEWAWCLRPCTLFGKKFESYLNSPARPKVSSQEKQYGATGIKIQAPPDNDPLDAFIPTH